MSFVLMLTCIIITLILVNLIRKSENKRFYELLKQFPSPPNYYPLIGNAHSLIGSLEDLLEKVEKICKPYDRFVYWIGPIPVLVLKKCEDIAAILNQSIDREDLGIMKDWLGIGILNAKPEEWKKSRRVLAPAFSSDMLSKYVKKFDKTASNLVEKFRPAANSGEEIDVLLQIKNSNLEAIVEAALGVSIQSCGKEGENFCNSVMEAMKEGAVRIQYPWLIPHHIYTIYLKWTGKTKDIEHLRYLPTKILREKMDNIRNSLGADNDSTDNANSSKTIIDLLISKSSTELGFNEIRIRDELLLMIASGAETTALTISFAMLMFAIHQDIQQKAYEEIQQLTTADYDELTEDHWTDHLKYLEQCIKETMRMFSPVMVTSRRTYKEIILKDNTIVPANMFVATFIHLANYDSELYKNPEKFDPQNFSDQAIKERPNCSQLNFGYGPRSCIGFKYAMMSIKAQLTYILRSYHLSSSIKQFTKENLKTDLSIRSRIGYPIKFTSR